MLAKLGPRLDHPVPTAHPDWRTRGVRVVHADALDINTPQSPGMNRAAAINLAKTGTRHHRALESVIYVVSGRARMRWGERLGYVAEAGLGDFIFVPPFVLHQEINASTDQEAVMVNLAVDPVEKPEAVHWLDPIHKAL